MGNTIILSAELETYELNSDKLLKEHAGEWVLIKGNSIIKFFKTHSSGLKEALKEFTDEPFLLRKVENKGDLLMFTYISS